MLQQVQSTRRTPRRGARSVASAVEKQDLVRIQGRWLAIAAIEGNQRTPEAELQKMRLVVTGENAVFFDGKQIRTGTYQMEAPSEPATIDVAVTAGPNEGKRRLGIYELEGDYFTMCLAGPDQERPQEFRSGPGRSLKIWRRVRK